MSGRVGTWRRDGQPAEHQADPDNEAGKLELLERVRRQSKAWERTIELAREAAGDKPVERMGIVHVRARKEARDFEARLREGMACPDEILIAELDPRFSVHSGAGMVGVAFVAGE
jgi:fatty acid-binding protein DegV